MTLSYDLSATSSAYASISRGYKAGGFNLGAGRLVQPSFKPEYLWNYEIGIKGDLGDPRVYAETSIFYEQRQDVQIRTGVQLDPVGDPNSYLFFTSNASKGYNYGLESSLRIKATSQLELGAALGLLRTRYQDFKFGDTVLADRDQPHAPHYQFAVDATWRHPSGWFSRVDFSGKDRFYFDVPGKPDTSSFNDTRSHPYTLTNVQVGYDRERWSASFWVHNVFDKNYAVRGFYFGNEPPDFPTKLYTQRGDPRQIGVSGKVKFL
jgi:outer membrane receptor protein involved in Fe transport